MAAANEVAIRLGREVRRGRYRMRQTQENLAAIIGVDQSTISRMELGRGKNIDLGTWVAVADVLGRSWRSARARLAESPSVRR